MSREASALVRYAAVGTVATAVHYALLIALVEVFGGPAWFGAGLGAVIGAQVAFAGNRIFTFEHRGDWRRSWLRFQITAVIGALLGMALVTLAQALRWHYLVGQAAATLAAMLLTFAINRHWAFAARPGRG
jgi:putative flippase GtrA